MYKDKRYSMLFFGIFQLYLIVARRISSYSEFMKKIIVFVFLIFRLFAKESVSVVVVGAGPVGLLTALEAYRAGMNVTIIEDRDRYTRSQSLFIFQEALDLLVDLGVYIPSMRMCEFDSDKNVGLLEINALEYALLEKVDELGILKIKGRFIQVSEQIALVSVNNEITIFPFDILIGADGFHSTVRNVMQVPVIRYESAVVSSAFIEKKSSLPIVEIPKAQNYKGLYVKKMVTPLGFHILIQKSLDYKDCEIDITNPKVIEEIAQAFGWREEAKLISEGHVVISGLTPVYLQRSILFGDFYKQFILVGDAAAVSSFIEGMGVNYGFQTAVKAKKFMFRYLIDKKKAYESFNQEMEALSVEFMEDGAYLIFSQPPINKVVESI
ncbi:MAG: FAD-dependent oxidoreductase [Chlamydiae bacterium]|nr:FAD-dependent oxidoreductase [Chlamydiota bacterium]